MYSMANAKPGDTVTRCIKVTYTGTLDASVKLYTPSSIGTLGQYVDLKVETGSQTGTPAAGSCTGFTADAGAAQGETTGSHILRWESQNQ